MTTESKAWEQAEIFQALDNAELEGLKALAIRRELPGGAVLTTEGEPVTSLTFIASGVAEVYKREKLQRNREHCVARLGPGDVVGEIALIDRQPASATVKTREPCVAYTIPFSAIHQSHLGPPLIGHLARIVATRLRKEIDEALQTAQRRTAMGAFLVNVLLLLCGYVAMLSALPFFSEKLPWDVALLSFPLQVVFGVGAWRFIRASGYPLADFGIGFRHLFGSLLESVVFTVPFLGVVTALKWIVIHTQPEYASMPLIEFTNVTARLHDPTVQMWLGIYAFSCLVQELIVRGALQSSLEIFLVGRRRLLRAVLVTALIFAVNHLHLSFTFAALAFVPGLFWGWLFARHRNLLGPTLSHIVVGSYVFFILGAPLPG